METPKEKSEREAANVVTEIRELVLDSFHALICRIPSLSTSERERCLTAAAGLVDNLKDAAEELGRIREIVTKD